MRAITVGICLTLVAGCEDAGKVSEDKAKEHVEVLGKWLESDLAEVRGGLPKAAPHLEKLYAEDADPAEDLDAVRTALEKARSKVQDLRVAKSTFFALANPEGTVLRNDQDQDRMAGKSLFSAFPKLKEAEKGFVETMGSMPEASSVKDADAQWVAAVPVKVGGSTRGLYVSGWSWSAYAYRLQNGLESELRPDEGEGKMPLVYTFVVVKDTVYRGYKTPEVNGKAIADQKPAEKTAGGKTYAGQIEITGRKFGLAIKPVEKAGEGVSVAVLRSET